MSIKVSFYQDDAIEYGVNAAIVLHTLTDRFISANPGILKEHNKRYWLVLSMEKLHKAMPYLTKPKIRSAIDLLKLKGILLVECHNEDPTDTTKWYSL